MKSAFQGVLRRRDETFISFIYAKPQGSIDATVGHHINTLKRIVVGTT